MVLRVPVVCRCADFMAVTKTKPFVQHLRSLGRRVELWVALLIISLYTNDDDLVHAMRRCYLERFFNEYKCAISAAENSTVYAIYRRHRSLPSLREHTLPTHHILHPRTRMPTSRRVTRQSHQLALRNIWTRFPHAVLAEIFKIYLEEDKDMELWDIPIGETPADGGRILLSYWSLESPQEFYNFGRCLLTLMQVCRQWRDVVVGTPALWKCVYVDSSLEWLDVCLQRSSNIPIYVAIANYNIRCLQPIADRLAAHAARIQKVQVFHVTSDALRILRRTVFSGSMSALSDVKLVGRAQRKVDTVPRLQYEVTEGHRCGVERLMIKDIFVDWRSNLFTHSLCEFTYYVYDAPMDPSPVSFDSFMHVLQECSGLGVFEIGGGCPFDPVDTDGNATVSSEVYVSLDNLKVFRLHVLPKAACRAILSHIRIPETAEVHILPLTTDEEDTDRLAHTIPAECRTQFPVFLGATWARITDKQFACGVPDQEELISFEVEHWAACEQPNGGRRPRTWGERFEARTVVQYLPDCMALLRGAPLRDLNLKVVFPGFSTAEWADIFSTFPALTTLHIEGAGPFEGLFEILGPHMALTGGQTSSPQGPDAMDVDEEEAHVLPDLRVMHLDCMWESRFIVDLLHCLEWRAARGLRLSELKINMTDVGGLEEEPTEETAELRDRSLAVLRGSVVAGPVTYSEQTQIDERKSSTVWA